MKVVMKNKTEGGYGQWLGNKQGINLSGFLKVKLRGAGLHIVYTLKCENEKILIIIIGAREDEKVCELAEKESGVCRKDKISAVFRWQTDPLASIMSIRKTKQKRRKRNK